MRGFAAVPPRSPLSCCAQSDYDAYDSYEGDVAPVLANTFEVGSCEITQFFLYNPEPVEVIANRLYKEATFTAVW